MGRVIYLGLLAGLMLFASAGHARAEWEIAMDAEGQRIFHWTNSRYGNYPTREACESARVNAVPSHDRVWPRHTWCEGTDDSAGNALPSSGETQGNTSDQDYRAKQEEEKQRKAFECEKKELLRAVKGAGNAPSGLKLKSSGAGGVLKLKTGDAPSAAVRDTTEERLRAAQKRIVELKGKISGIQSLLRQYTRSLANNSAEFDKWGQTIDESYESVLSNSKEYLLGLFLEYNLLGNLKEVRKDSFGRLGRFLNSPNSKVKSWLRKELGWRRVELDRLEKLVKLGQAEGDFAALLDTEDEIRKNLDALILVSDLLDVVDKKIPGGSAFQHARMIGETYADLASISYGWFSINRLGKHTDRMTVEVDSLSFRMRHAIKEIDCLEACVANYTERCLEKCTGKTRLHTPPPLPR